MLKFTNSKRLIIPTTVSCFPINLNGFITYFIAKQEREIHVSDFRVSWKTRIEDRGSRIEDRGSGIGDRGSGIGDRGSGIGDRGSGIGDRGKGIKEKILNN